MRRYVDQPHTTNAICAHGDDTDRTEKRIQRVNTLEDVWKIHDLQLKFTQYRKEYFT